MERVRFANLQAVPHGDGYTVTRNGSPVATVGQNGSIFPLVAIDPVLEFGIACLMASVEFYKGLTR